MKKFACVCVILMLALVANASAQLVAGSPEDSLFQQIVAAGSTDDKIALATQFTEEFPNAPTGVMVSVYTILMNGYEQQQDHRQALEHGKRIIEMDPGNVNAYMSLCRFLSVNLREDLDMAVEYGEQAVALATELKDRETPPNYTPEQWQAYAAQTEEYARSILSYARTIR